MKLEVRDALDAQAVCELLKAVEPHAVDCATVSEMVAGCTLLDVLEDGELVGAVALEITGSEATITAGTSRGRASYHAMELIEKMLVERGVNRVKFETKRVGLIHHMWAIGYEVEACTMTKGLR